MGIGCYIQYTLNDYFTEGLEPNVTSMAERINTFKQFVEELGLEAVVWRFDPLVLTDKISADTLLNKIENIAERYVKEYTKALEQGNGNIGESILNLYDYGKLSSLT